MNPEQIETFARGWFADFGAMPYDTEDSLARAIRYEAYGVTFEDVCAIARRVLQLRDADT